MNALDWIGYLMEWLGKWVPRIQIVRRTQGGVRFVCGRSVKEVRPGVRVYWPIITDMVLVSIVPQTDNLISQSMMTKDRVQVSASMILVYRIANPVRALTETAEIGEMVNNLCLAALLEVVAVHSLQELQDGLSTDLEIKLTKLCRKRLHRYGVRVQRAAFTDFTTCRTLNLVHGDGKM